MAKEDHLATIFPMKMPLVFSLFYARPRRSSVVVMKADIMPKVPQAYRMKMPGHFDITFLIQQRSGCKKMAFHIFIDLVRNLRGYMRVFLEFSDGINILKSVGLLQPRLNVFIALLRRRFFPDVFGALCGRREQSPGIGKAVFGGYQGFSG
jgi:hypothetical protein